MIRGHVSFTPCFTVVLVLGLVRLVTGFWLSYDRPNKSVVDNPKAQTRKKKKKKKKRNGQS